MMGQTGELRLLEGAIQQNKNAKRIYVTFSLIVVLLGVGILVGGFLFARVLLPGVDSTLFDLGGGFIASLAGFPLKHFLARGDRIRHLQSLKKQLIILQENAQENFKEIKDLNMRIWNYCEKISS